LKKIQEYLSLKGILEFSPTSFGVSLICDLCLFKAFPLGKVAAKPTDEVHPQDKF
jgi:hypothetical protein